MNIGSGTQYFPFVQSQLGEQRHVQLPIRSHHTPSGAAAGSGSSHTPRPAGAVTVRTVHPPHAPSRKLAAAQLQHLDGPSNNHNNNIMTGASPRGAKLLHQKSDATSSSSPSYVHKHNDLRELEMLQVFQERREKYVAALRQARRMVKEVELATDFIPHIRQIGGGGAMPSYNIGGGDGPGGEGGGGGAGHHHLSSPKASKGNLANGARELTVLLGDDDEAYDDLGPRRPDEAHPLDMEDVDTEEQEALTKAMRAREVQHFEVERRLSRRYENSGGADVVATDGGGGAMEGTSSRKSSAVVALDNGANHPFLPHGKRLLSTPEKSHARNCETLGIALDDNPSEIARKRRIIRRLWLGNSVHLKDLAALRGVPVNDPTAAATADLLDDGGGNVVLGADDDVEEAASMRRNFSNKAIPPPPGFSSNSLGLIMDAVCRDAQKIVHATESVLRMILSQQSRRVGCLDGEVQRSAYFAEKATLWAETGRIHAAMYKTGELTMSSGLSLELAQQRRLLLGIRDEITGLERSVEFATAEQDSAQRQIELLQKQIVVRHFIVDRTMPLEFPEQWSFGNRRRSHGSPTSSHRSTSHHDDEDSEQHMQKLRRQSTSLRSEYGDEQDDPTSVEAILRLRQLMEAAALDIRRRHMRQLGGSMDVAHHANDAPQPPQQRDDDGGEEGEAHAQPYATTSHVEAVDTLLEALGPRRGARGATRLPTDATVAAAGGGRKSLTGLSRLQSVVKRTASVIALSVPTDPHMGRGSRSPSVSHLSAVGSSGQPTPQSVSPAVKPLNSQAVGPFAGIARVESKANLDPRRKSSVVI